MGRPPISQARARGFTLFEMIMVIVITGIISGVVAVFLQSPVQGYVSAVRRADMSDSADTALRRIARDVQSALPNSVRSSNPLFLEYLPARSGGRYCASGDCGNALDTTAPDTAFTVLGPCVEIQSGDSIVIYNTGQTGANAYAAAENRSAFSLANSATTGCTDANTYSRAGFASFQFPRDSPTYRFDVVSTPVTYACDSANATLWRFSGYAIQPGQPVTLSGAQLVTGSGNITGARLATNVLCSDVSNIGTGFEVRTADGLVALRIELQSSGETLNLFREVHIDNAP